MLLPLLLVLERFGLLGLNGRDFVGFQGDDRSSASRALSAASCAAFKRLHLGFGCRLLQSRPPPAVSCTAPRQRSWPALVRSPARTLALSSASRFSRACCSLSRAVSSLTCSLLARLDAARDLGQLLVGDRLVAPGAALASTWRWVPSGYGTGHERRTLQSPW